MNYTNTEQRCLKLIVL